MIIKIFDLQKEGIFFTFSIIETTKFIIFNYKKFISVPPPINIVKGGKFLSFSVSDFKYKLFLLAYFNFFLKFVKNVKRDFCKKLTLVGLGFRITLLENGCLLRFKLGFSHLVDIVVPTQLRAIVRKNNLYLLGVNPIFLGNFCKKIQLLKRPNAYTGKGFWFKNKKQTLKVFKKK
jgi:ribosomal protein L6P/L9E